MIDPNSLKKLYLGIKSNAFRYWAIRAAKAVGMRHLVVRVDTNHLCNIRCRMCYFSSKATPREGPMAYELYEKIAEELFPRTRVLYLSCNAEPLCTPGFPKYVRKAKELGVPYISITSNCMLLTPKQSKELITAGLDEIIVSVTGGTRETYEDNHVGASWDKLWENLADLEREKKELGRKIPSLKFNYILTRSSIHETEGFIERIRPLGIQFITLRELFSFDATDSEFYARSKLTSDDLVQVERVKKAFDRAGIQVVDSLQCTSSAKEPDYDAIPARYPCVQPFFQVYIRPNGDMRYCVFREPVGSLRQQSFAEITSSPKAREFRKNLKKKSTSCVRNCPNFFDDIVVK